MSLREKMLETENLDVEGIISQVEKDGMEDLINLGRDKDFRIRWNCARIISYILERDPEKIKELKNLLMEMLSDHHRLVRNWASISVLKVARKRPELLGEIAEPYLERFIGGDDYEKFDSLKLLEYIKRNNPKVFEKFKDRIVELSKDDNPVVRYQAKRVLEE